MAAVLHVCAETFWFAITETTNFLCVSLSNYFVDSKSICHSWYAQSCFIVVYSLWKSSFGCVVLTAFLSSPECCLIYPWSCLCYSLFQMSWVVVLFFPGFLCFSLFQILMSVQILAVALTTMSASMSRAPTTVVSRLAFCSTWAGVCERQWMPGTTSQLFWLHTMCGHSRVILMHQYIYWWHAFFVNNARCYDSSKLLYHSDSCDIC